MVHGGQLFFALFNNLAIFIALVAVYGYLLAHINRKSWFSRQLILGLSFGIFAISCMYAKIPVFEGVIVDQRNAIVVLSGVFGGGFSALISAVMVGAFRYYLGGNGALAGVIGVGLATLAGIGLHKLFDRFKSPSRGAASAFFATLIILPGFLFVGDIQTGWNLTKAMAIPYGSAIFVGIIIGGLLLRREEDRLDIELLLRANEEKYREVIEGTQELIAKSDGKGIVTFVNPVAEKILGCHGEECIGKSVFQYIHPEDVERTENWISACIEQKNPQTSIEIRCVNQKTGASSYLLWSSAFRFNEFGELVETSNIAHDITAQKIAEESIKESELRYRTLFEYVPDGILITDKNGHCLDANPAMYQMMGSARGDLFSLRTAKIVTHLEIQKMLSMDGLAQAKADYFQHREFQKKDGSTVSTELKITPMSDGNYLTTVRDVTERQRMESQLLQAQKMEAIGRMAGGIAHDLNNMLSPILGYAELMVLESANSDNCKAMSKQIFQAGQKARNLVHQLLAYSRKQTLEYRSLNLNTIIKDFEKLLRRTIREDINIKINTFPEIPAIKADQGQIEQVVMNLCVNAQDAMPQGGRLILDIDMAELDCEYTQKHPSCEPGQYVMLAVTDTGMGMDASIQQQVFDPFFSTKGELGTGLGLSTVYGIVKQHNGHIWIYSEPGKGTTIKVYFPTTEEDPYLGGEEDFVELEKLIGSETILLVEDNAAVRELAWKILERQGYQVIYAANGKEALELLKKQNDPIDLLLTDVVMPDMNGKELFEEMNNGNKRLKVLYMSGYTNEIIVHHGVLEDRVMFIQKPFTIHKLARKVREALEPK